MGLKKICITGSSGFVGQNLVRYLSSRGFLIMMPNRQDLQKKHRFDFSDCEAVIHLAGKAHDSNYMSNIDEYSKVNYELTKDLYDAFIKSDASKFIFLSTVKASADHADVPLKEDHHPNPNTHYGLSKLKAEKYILSHLLPKDKHTFILRPCMIHGPGNKGNLNLLFKMISKGIPYPLAAFQNRRSFLSIKNLCFVICELLERNDIASGVYNVSDDEALSTNELIRLIGQALNKKTWLCSISPSLIRLFAKFGDKLKLPLTTERLNKLTENYIVDNSKIRAALGKGFPEQASDGIITTIKSFQLCNKK